MNRRLLGKADFIKWYEEEVETAAQNAENFRKSVQFFNRFYLTIFLFLLVIFTLVYGVLIVLLRIDSGDWDFLHARIFLWANFFIYLYLFAYMIGGALLIKTLAQQKENATQFFIKEGKLFPMSDDAWLNEMLDEICSVTGLNRNAFAVYTNISMSVSASVEEENGKYILVVPLGFVHFSEVDPASARAILYHEVGHILQNDTKLFRYTFTFSEIYRKIMVPYILINIGLALVSVVKFLGSDYESESQIWIWLGMIASIIVNLYMLDRYVRNYKGIIAARKNSELLADAASVLFGESGNDLKKIFEQQNNVAVNVNDKIHPAGSDRAANVDLLYKKYNLAAYE